MSFTDTLWPVKKNGTFARTPSVCPGIVSITILVYFKYVSIFIFFFLERNLKFTTVSHLKGFFFWWNAVLCFYS